MEKAQYDANTIANWFLAVAASVDIILTRKSLQKILYFAQAHHVEIFNKPLFQDKIEAYEHGPVVISVWQVTRQLARYGDDNDYSVSQYQDIDFDNFSDEINDFLLTVWNTYGKLSAQYLENKTHKELAYSWNWDDKTGRGTEITPELLGGYYIARSLVNN